MKWRGKWNGEESEVERKVERRGKQSPVISKRMVSGTQWVWSTFGLKRTPKERRGSAEEVQWQAMPKGKSKLTSAFSQAQVSPKKSESHLHLPHLQIPRPLQVCSASQSSFSARPASSHRQCLPDHPSLKM